MDESLFEISQLGADRIEVAGQFLLRALHLCRKRAFIVNGYVFFNPKPEQMPDGKVELSHTHEDLREPVFQFNIELQDITRAFGLVFVGTTTPIDGEPDQFSDLELVRIALINRPA